jgi:hypothetical protein
MRACWQSLCIVMLLQGCGAQPDSLASDAESIAELRIDASPLLAANVGRVTVDAAGQTADLVINQNTGTFDGTLLLPAGMQTFVARAFSGATLVGQSAPTPATIQAGVVTRVMIRILDLTPDSPPVYGPILDSLSFPTTAIAGLAANFAISVVAPAGDPITYAWTSDCPDSTFGSPTAAATTWTRPAEGSCTIHVVATSNGLSVSQGFAIVVFPAGSSEGAALVSAAFITRPGIVLNLFGGSCGVDSVNLGRNASCATTIASPDHTSYLFNVFSWGGSTPGPFAVSVDCGGSTGLDVKDSTTVGGPWVPPVAGGLCIFTATATNGEGLTSTLHLAVLSRAGTPLPPADPPGVTVIISNDQFACDVLGPETGQCPPVAAGTVIRASALVMWRDGLAGGVTTSDSCAGPQSLASAMFDLYTSTSWTVSGRPGQMCTTTATATNLEGASTTRTLQYMIGSP